MKTAPFATLLSSRREAWGPNGGEDALSTGCLPEESDGAPTAGFCIGVVNVVAKF